MKSKVVKIAHRIITSYLKIATKWGKKFGIDRGIILAVIHKESGGNPKAVGKAGERGLMQILLSTALEIAQRLGIHPYTHDMLFNPDTNIMFGTFYLSKMQKMCKNDTDEFNYIAAYNGGYGGRNLSQCQQYKRAVLSLREQFYKEQLLRVETDEGKTD